MGWGYIVKRLTDDGVVANFQSMTVFENEDGRGLRRFGSGFGAERSVVWLHRSGSHRSASVGGAWVRWRNVGVASRTAAVEEGGASLIIGVVVILLGVVDIDGVGDGQRVNIWVIGVTAHSVMVVTAAAVGNLIMEIEA